MENGTANHVCDVIRRELVEVRAGLEKEKAWLENTENSRKAICKRIAQLEQKQEELVAFLVAQGIDPDAAVEEDDRL